MKASQVIGLLKAQRNQLILLNKAIQTKLDGSPYTTLSLRALQQAQIFTGATIGMLSGEVAYPTGNDPKSAVIDPLKDPAKGEFYFSDPELDRVIKIKELRVAIVDVKSEIEKVLVDGVDNEDTEDIKPLDLFYVGQNLPFILTQLQAGSNWLGMELGAIRDLKQAENETI